MKNFLELVDVLAVGGSKKFVEECVSTAKAAGIRVSLTAHTPENLCKSDSGTRCFGILIPSSWIEKMPQLVAAFRGAKIFVAGAVTKEQLLRCCDAYAEARVFVVPGEPHKAVLGVEKVLRETLVPVELNGDEIYRDTLTGCYTRRYLTEQFSYSGHYAVVFIDLDNFKPVNDILGHEAGDRVLAVFGRVLNDNLKGRDLAVRWGGDEFVLILPETSRANAERIVENLKKAWKSCAPDTGNLEVGFSAGVAEGRSAADLQKAVKEADRLMYAAKKAEKTKKAWRGAREAGGVVFPVAAPAKAEGDTWLSAVWVASKVITEVIAVTGLVSLAVWLADFVMRYAGGHSPYLHEAARVVEWFWKTVYMGLMGRAA